MRYHPPASAWPRAFWGMLRALLGPGSIDLAVTPTGSIDHGVSTRGSLDVAVSLLGSLEVTS